MPDPHHADRRRPTRAPQGGAAVHTTPASLLALALGLCCLAAVATASADDNPIVIENRAQGTWDWVLSKPANDREHQIKGYASKASVAHGERLDFHVSVSPPQDYRIQIYRMGWYGGTGGRFMMESDPLQGRTQPPAVLDETTGLITTPWSADYSLSIPDEWVSGVYAAKLINAEGFDNYIIFVVRDDERTADLLFQRSVTTDQAYNNYPDDGRTGKSLYNFNSYGRETVAGELRAVKVSFDRPYARKGDGSFFDWEFQLLRWLERQGYDVSYSTNIDTHRRPSRLLDFSAFLSTGHDEYWSKAMRDAVTAARDGGVHVAFFGANAGYWQTRFEPSSDGVPDRIITVYKNQQLDPVTDLQRKTILFRDIPGRAEQQLIGVQYLSFGDWDENTDFVVANSDHWLYQGTGFSDGDRVRGIIGYEIDSFQSEYAAPPGTDQTLLSASPYQDTYGNTVIANASIYQAPSGAWVFASGTMSWSWALDEPGYVDARIQQTTANLIAAFTGAAPPEEPSPCGSPLGASGTPTDAGDERLVYEDAEDGDTAGWRVYAGTGDIENRLDEERGSCVIALTGNGMDTGYVLSSADGSAWQDRERTLLSLALSYGEPFTVYVDVDTSAGQRYLYYSPTGIGDNWTWENYIHYGLDGDLAGGGWQRLERDLAADLQAVEPESTLVQVNRILIRGSGRVDDIALSRAASAPENIRTYEDAEDGETAGWRVYAGLGSIENLQDSQQGSRVIALQGTGTDTGYQLRDPSGNDWQDGERSLLALELSYSEPFLLYIDVETSAGQRYLHYSPAGLGNDWTWENYIHYGLDQTLTDGAWQRIERDLAADLRSAEPGVELLQVNALLIRGSGRVDNVELRGNE